MTLNLLRNSAFRPLRRLGVYGLSAFAFPGCDSDEVARRAKIPHDEICEAAAGEIAAAGFELRRTFSTPGHFTLVFADEPSDEDLVTVMELFAACKENRYRRSR